MAILQYFFNKGVFLKVMMYLGDFVYFAKCVEEVLYVGFLVRWEGDGSVWVGAVCVGNYGYVSVFEDGFDGGEVFSLAVDLEVFFVVFYGAGACFCEGEEELLVVGVLGCYGECGSLLEVVLVGSSFFEGGILFVEVIADGGYGSVFVVGLGFDDEGYAVGCLCFVGDGL